MKTLTYFNGNEMDPTPTGDIPTARAAAMCLRNNGAVPIELQPGDATWYRFVLIDYSFHGYDSVREGYGILPYSGITVTYTAGMAWIPEDLSILSEHHLAFIENDWSRTLLTWWLREYLAPRLAS